MQELLAVGYRNKFRKSFKGEHLKLGNIIFQ